MFKNRDLHAALFSLNAGLHKRVAGLQLAAVFRR